MSEVALFERDRIIRAIVCRRTVTGIAIGFGVEKEAVAALFIEMGYEPFDPPITDAPAYFRGPQRRQQ